MAIINILSDRDKLYLLDILILQNKTKLEFHT